MILRRKQQVRTSWNKGRESLKAVARSYESFTPRDRYKKVRLFELNGTVRDVLIDPDFYEPGNGTLIGKPAWPTGTFSLNSDRKTFDGDTVRLTLALQHRLPEYPTSKVVFCVMKVLGYTPALLGRKISAIGARTQNGVYYLRTIRCLELELVLATRDVYLFGDPSESDGWIYE